MRKLLYALTIAALLIAGVAAQQAGGAFLPGFAYTITGGWTFAILPALTGYGSAVGTSGAQTLTSKTLTSPVLTTPTGTQSTLLVQATKSVAAAESGTTFFLNHANEFVSTLPAPAAGLTYTFVVTGAPAGANYTVVSASSANIMAGACISAGGDASSWLGDADTVTFVAAQAVPGDFVKFTSDGTSWFVTGVTKVAAGCTVTKATA